MWSAVPSQASRQETKTDRRGRVTAKIDHRRRRAGRKTGTALRSARGLAESRAASAGAVRGQRVCRLGAEVPTAAFKRA